MRKIDYVAAAMLALSALSCAPKPEKIIIPSLEYTTRLKQQLARQGAQQQPRAQLRLVADQGPLGAVEQGSAEQAALPEQGALALAPDAAAGQQPGYYEYRSSAPQIRDYNGPLSLGDPGVTASLWRESRSASELFRDDRAWQPMDLITIVVSESSEGKKSADTEVKEQSSIAAAIENLVGYEATSKANNPNVKLDNLLNATTQNDFKGEGSTNRKDSLKARISAMVVEILPSGILRVEGERRIAVNSEEQVMVISGLVRTRDITSTNEVESSKMANLRIDYYGSGIVGEAQNGGWLSRFIRVIWPF